MKSPVNISASVRQRLLNRSKLDKRSFNELLQYYAMERFLYRLSISGHAHRFILKGALMLRTWKSPEFRPTMDIDLLGKTGNGEAEIIKQIRDIIMIDVQSDGLSFDPESIQSERITKDADYEGIRVSCRGLLGKARINLRIDIGFGDSVYPEPEKAEFPCILDYPAPVLLCYSRESTIAEKFEAMVKLGYLNSSMKDFYDIWLLSRYFRFEFTDLAEAVRLTFKQRGTELNQPVEAFSAEFVSSKQNMWIAFCKRLKLDNVSLSFQDIVNEVESFLIPVVKGIPELKKWKPSGPWS